MMGNYKLLKIKRLIININKRFVIFEYDIIIFDNSFGCFYGEIRCVGVHKCAIVQNNAHICSSDRTIYDPPSMRVNLTSISCRL